MTEQLIFGTKELIIFHIKDLPSYLHLESASDIYLLLNNGHVKDPKVHKKPLQQIWQLQMKSSAKAFQYHFASTTLGDEVASHPSSSDISTRKNRT